MANQSDVKRRETADGRIDADSRSDRVSGSSRPAIGDVHAHSAPGLAQRQHRDGRHDHACGRCKARTGRRCWQIRDDRHDQSNKTGLSVIIDRLFIDMSQKMTADDRRTEADRLINGDAPETDERLIGGEPVSPRSWRVRAWFPAAGPRCCSSVKPVPGKEIIARAIHEHSPFRTRPVPPRELRRHCPRD